MADLERTPPPHVGGYESAPSRNQPVSPTRSVIMLVKSLFGIGRNLPVASAKTCPEALASTPLASKIRFLRFASISPVAMISSSGRTGFRNRAFNSAQNANRRVGTAQAQTMISSRTVVKMPPWIMPRKPLWAERNRKRVCTTRPSVVKRSFSPTALLSPQTKQ